MSRYIENDLLSWQDKYDIIFNQYGEVIRDCPITFDYYDPDSGYKDDVLAFYNAAKGVLEQVKSIATIEGLNVEMLLTTNME